MITAKSVLIASGQKRRTLREGTEEKNFVHVWVRRFHPYEGQRREDMFRLILTVGV